MGPGVHPDVCLPKEGFCKDNPTDPLCQQNTEPTPPPPPPPNTCPDGSQPDADGKCPTTITDNNTTEGETAVE